MFLLRCLVALMFALDASAAEPLRVAVMPDSLRFTWPGRDGAVEVREQPLHTSATEGEGRVVWSGDARGGMASVPRFDGARDRLFAKFELRAAGQPLGPAQHGSDFSALPRRTHSLGSRDNKKGVGSLIGFDEAKALGLG